MAKTGSSSSALEDDGTGPRTSDYENALSLFKRLSRAEMEEIKGYAIGRRYLLKSQGLQCAPTASEQARSPARNKKLEALNRRIARFRKQLTTVSREREDVREIMSTQGWAGFRIDDPAAVTRHCLEISRAIEI